MDSDLTWCGDRLDESAERFMARVDTSGACWEWTGPHHRAGYGYARLAGARKHTTAHRVAYMLATGRPIPRGAVVRHACDRPPCVNPAHLELGTNLDNVMDRVRRGRGRNGNSGPLPGNLSTRAGTTPPSRPGDPPPVDLEVDLAMAARRARYGA